jgi:hypothetical protein
MIDTLIHHPPQSSSQPGRARAVCPTCPAPRIPPTEPTRPLVCSVCSTEICYAPTHPAQWCPTARPASMCVRLAPPAMLCSATCVWSILPRWARCTRVKYLNLLAAAHNRWLHAHGCMASIYWLPGTVSWWRGWYGSTWAKISSV